MPTAGLEHVNISVTDADGTATLPEKLTCWYRHWEGPTMNGGHTIHIGIAVEDLDEAEAAVVAIIMLGQAEHASDIIAALEPAAPIPAEAEPIEDARRYLAAG